MYRLYLIILGIFIMSFTAIVAFNVQTTTPFQTMEWQALPAPEQASESDEAVTVEEDESDSAFSVTLPAAPVPVDYSEVIDYEVPFTAQAPFAEWNDPRYQDGCEEASVLMAIKAVKGEGLTRNEAKAEIAAISQYELENWGSYVDTSASSTLARIVEGYFKYMGRVEYGIDQDDIIEALYANNLVLVPTNGVKLKNPNYSPPGPERHMLVVKGYDPATAEFITHDPGTRNGADYRYDAAVLMEALFDYPTGNHVPATEDRTAMIIIPL